MELIVEIFIVSEAVKTTPTPRPYSPQATEKTGATKQGTYFQPYLITRIELIVNYWVLLSQLKIVSFSLFSIVSSSILPSFCLSLSIFVFFCVRRHLLMLDYGTGRSKNVIWHEMPNSLQI